MLMLMLMLIVMVEKFTYPFKEGGTVPPPFNIIPTLKVSLIHSKVKPITNMTNAKIEWEGAGWNWFWQCQQFLQIWGEPKVCLISAIQNINITITTSSTSPASVTSIPVQTIYFLFRCVTGKTNRDLKQRAMSVKVNTILIIITKVKALIILKPLQHKITLAREKEEQYEAIMQNLVRRYVTEVPHHSSYFRQDLNMGRNIYMR